MDEFESKLDIIDIAAVQNYLYSLDKPCFESSLLKIAFKIENISDLDSLDLYRDHFLLFHVLYKLQDEFYKSDKYLYVHFMRTFLTDYPAKDKCRYYDEYSGLFCAGGITADSSYCSYHLKKIGNSNVENLSIKYFYLDKTNFYKLNGKQADDLINGAWEVLSFYDEYKESFKVLDLPETSDLDTIKKRYKYLAKKYHPDCVDGYSSSLDLNRDFTRINNAYRFLLKMIERGNFF